MPDVAVFTREGCGLCEGALALVEREMARLLGPPRLRFSPCTCGPTSVLLRAEYADGSVLQVVDVDLEPGLGAAFGFEVPVVRVKGGPSFSLELDARVLVAALARATGAMEAARP